MSAQFRPKSSKVRWLVVTGLVIFGMVLVLFFGFRAHRAYYRLHERGLVPGTADVEAIRGWMTLPYIAKAYDVPVEVIFAETGLPQAGNEHLSLRQLAANYGRDPVEVRQAIQEVIRHYHRRPHPPKAGATP